MRRILIIFMILFSAQNFYGQTTDNNNCLQCHTCEQPTKTNPCLINCPREHDIKSFVSAKTSPEIIDIHNYKSDEGQYGKVMFNHKAHAVMSEFANSCSDCHHYSSPHAVPSCNECHELEKSRDDFSKPNLLGAFHQQCMKCHSTFQEKTECASCHNQNETWKEDQIKNMNNAYPIVLTFNIEDEPKVVFKHKLHVDEYELTCNDCHEAETCSDCHINDEVKMLKKEDHDKCSDCHETDDCESCHID